MKQTNSYPVPQIGHFERSYHFIAEVTFKEFKQSLKYIQTLIKQAYV